MADKQITQTAGDNATQIGEVLGNLTIINNFKTDQSDTDETDKPSPYRGLSHFEPKHAEFFFGRDVFIKELVDLTQEQSFIPILGASGSGKSSVVLAGLIPALGQVDRWKEAGFPHGRWVSTNFRPGKDPFLALASTLVPLYEPNLISKGEQRKQARQLKEDLQKGDLYLAGDIVDMIRDEHSPDHRILLIVDQFEEIFTQCSNEDARLRFLEVLAEASIANREDSPLVIVSTMRADFLGQALGYRALTGILKHAVMLGPMRREELQETIEKPIERLNEVQQSKVEFEDELVERILNDLKDIPGNLPLLEYALDLLWKKHSDDKLTHEDYETIGKVEGSLAKYANAEYEKLSKKLDKSQLERIPHIFTQMIQPGKGTEDTRRIATRKELGEDDWKLVTMLADARLIVTRQNEEDKDTAEVVHEALIRNWDKLEVWINEIRKFRVWQEQLRFFLNQWDDKNDDGALLRGGPLAEALDWLSKRQSDIGSEEKSFIEKSQERQSQEEQRWKELYTEAEQQRKLASAQLLAAQGELQLLTGNVDTASRGALLIIESMRRTPTSLLCQRALSGAMDFYPPLLNQLMYSEIGEKDNISVEAISPDGRRLAIGEGHTVRIWEIEKKKIIFKVDQPEEITTLVFDPSGKLLAIGCYVGFEVWNIDKNDLLTKITQPPGYIVQALAFDNDGKRIVMGDSQGLIKVYDVKVKENKPQISLDFLTGDVTGVKFSYNGQWLAVTGWHHQVEEYAFKVYDLRTKQEILSNISLDVTSFAFSSDDKYVIAGGYKNARLWQIIPPPPSNDNNDNEKDKSVRVTDYASFKTEGYTSALNFHPAREILAIASASTIKLWDFRERREIGTLRHEDVRNIAFVSNGELLVTSGSKSVCKWDLKCGEKISSRIQQEKKPLEDTDELEKLLPGLCLRIGRNLTNDEWIEYFPGESFHRICAEPMDPNQTSR